MLVRERPYLIPVLLSTGMLLQGCSSETGDTAKAGQPVVKTATAGRPADNRLCLACHELLAEEDISYKHETKDLLCIDCHGASRAHMEDEMLMTKADVLFGRTEVDPFCQGCHPAHKEPAKVEAFREEWQGRNRPNGRVITSSSICTDCHGTHNLHRIDTDPTTASRPARAQASPVSPFNSMPTADAQDEYDGSGGIGYDGDLDIGCGSMRFIVRRTMLRLLGNRG